MGATTAIENQVVIGVSSCLCGEAVRYDGGHKRDRFVADVLPRLFRVRALCPEAGAGLGVPRPPVHLEQREDGVHAVGVERPELDVTAALQRYADDVVPELAELYGYVFKSRSPSCGLKGVPLRQGGRWTRSGRGLFAAALSDARPLLPAVEEGEVQDAAGHRLFVERVEGYRRWRSRGPMDLRRFHRREQLTLLAHGARRARALGRWLEGGEGVEPAEYGRRFMAALAYPLTRRREQRAMGRALRRLAPQLDDAQRQQAEAAVAAFAAGEQGWLAPILLLQSLARQVSDPWLMEQSYLNPSPAACTLARDGGR